MSFSNPLDEISVALSTASGFRKVDPPTLTSLTPGSISAFLWKISVYLSPEAAAIDIPEEKSSSVLEKSSSDFDEDEVPKQRSHIEDVVSDLTMPQNFHAYISHGVIDLLKMTCPSALSSQPELWEYLISLTLCSSASEARSVLSSLSMDDSIRSPSARLNKYLLDFRLTLSRCRLCINKPSMLFEAFIKGISIRPLNNALWDEFKCGNISSFQELISITMETFEHVNSTAYQPNFNQKNNPPFRNRPSKNFQASPHSRYGTPSSRSSSSMSNFKSPSRTSNFHSSPHQNSPSSGRFCNFCKKPGHTIDFCRDPECKRNKLSPSNKFSNNSKPQSQPKNKPYNRRNPTVNRTYGTRQNTAPQQTNCIFNTPETFCTEDTPIEFDLELPKFLNNPYPGSDTYTVSQDLPDIFFHQQKKSTNLTQMDNPYKITSSNLSPDIVPAPEEITSPLRRIKDVSYGYGRPHALNSVLSNGADDGRLENLEILINNVPILATIDSACQTSCFTSDIAELTKSKVIPSPLSFTLADGKSAKCSGNALCTLTFCFDRLISPAVHLKSAIPIIPGKCQVLIGVDILKKLGLLKKNGLMIKLNHEHKRILDVESCLDSLVPQPICTKEPVSVNKLTTDELTQCRISLSDNHHQLFINLMNSFHDIFGTPHPLGIDCPPMPIDFYNNEETCYKKGRPLNPHKLEIANSIFDDLIKDGFAEEAPANCPFSSPIVLVIYPDGKKPRLTGDYSGSPGINSLTKPMDAHLPRISDISLFLSKANFIATLDLPKAFWQLSLDPKDYLKTTLSIPGRSIYFKRAAFGLKNVPAFFQNVMENIFNMPNVFIYLDDVIIAAESFDILLETLKKIFELAKAHRVRFGLKKCAFVTSADPIKILGAIFHNKQRSIDPDRISAISNLPIPSTIGELRSFIGSL
ncbi:hypothetical protein GEMRC1_002860 [Eukaryota sp. GEM-RC1]